MPFCLCFLCYYTQQYCMYILNLWQWNYLLSVLKFLLKSLACLCPRQCFRDYQLCGQTGPLHKVISPFLSTLFSTGYMVLLPGAVSTPSQALLHEASPFCHWQLALSTMSGWERCLLQELEIGVQCKQREHTWVSLVMINIYSVQALQESCTSGALFCNICHNNILCVQSLLLCVAIIASDLWNFWLQIFCDAPYLLACYD